MLLLIRTFLLAARSAGRVPLRPAALAEMAKHDWPGNVRELRNYVERSVVLQSASPGLRRGQAGGPPQRERRSRERDRSPVPFRISKDAVIDSFERGYLSQLLEAAGGNMIRRPAWRAWTACISTARAEARPPRRS